MGSGVEKKGGGRYRPPQANVMPRGRRQLALLCCATTPQPGWLFQAQLLLAANEHRAKNTPHETCKGNTATHEPPAQPCNRCALSEPTWLPCDSPSGVSSTILALPLEVSTAELAHQTSPPPRLFSPPPLRTLPVFSISPLFFWGFHGPVDPSSQLARNRHTTGGSSSTAAARRCTTWLTSATSGPS